MKNVIFYLVATLVLLNSGYSQSKFNLGLTLGISSSTVEVSEIGNTFTNTIKGNNIVGVEGGLFARYNMNPLFLKGMFLIAYSGGLSTFRNDDGTFNKSKFATGKLELPLLIGLKIIGPLRVEAGPVINWVFSETHDADKSIKIRKVGAGYRIGANVEFGILNLGLAFQGLKNSSNDNSTATYSRPSELIFSLGILLSGTD